MREAMYSTFSFRNVDLREIDYQKEIMNMKPVLDSMDLVLSDPHINLERYGEGQLSLRCPDRCEHRK